MYQVGANMVPTWYPVGMWDHLGCTGPEKAFRRQSATVPDSVGVEVFTNTGPVKADPAVAPQAFSRKRNALENAKGPRCAR